MLRFRNTVYAECLRFHSPRLVLGRFLKVLSLALRLTAFGVGYKETMRGHFSEGIGGGEIELKNVTSKLSSSLLNLRGTVNGIST